MKKTVLITGSTDGIGKQTAIGLARQGFNVFVHGRDERKCIDTVNQIKGVTKNIHIKYFVADFSSVDEIKKLSEILNSETDTLDVLINNAGVYMHKREVNDKGIELTFMINHLAHFYLTYLLIHMIKRSHDGRIINVSSIAHENAEIHDEDFMLRKNYSGYTAYANSKLYNILFTRSLERRLRNSNVKVFALHPGVISTKLLYEGFRIKGSPVEIGAETSIYLAVSDDVKEMSGKYFVKKKPVSPSRLSFDEKLQEKLWDYSIQLLGLDKLEVENRYISW